MRRPGTILSCILVAVPFAVATVALSPVSLSEDPVAATTEVTASPDVAESRLIRPEPSTPPPSPQVEQVAPRQAKKATAGETAAERDARVRQDAMVPHPRPPAVPYIAPDVQAAIDSANNAPPINLGTLTPPKSAPPSH
jgi:hypothetical protein